MPLPTVNGPAAAAVGESIAAVAVVLSGVHMWLDCRKASMSSALKHEPRLRECCNGHGWVWDVMCVYVCRGGGFAAAAVGVRSPTDATGVSAAVSVSLRWDATGAVILLS